MPDDTTADPAVSAVLGFLLEQRWLASLRYRDIVKSHDYGGAVFLLHVRSRRNETIVWHKGRSASPRGAAFRASIAWRTLAPGF